DSRPVGPCRLRRDNRVDDELGDPERGDRKDRAREPKHRRRHSVAAMRLPHETQQRRYIPNGLEAFAPGEPRFVAVSDYYGMRHTGKLRRSPAAYLSGGTTNVPTSPL